MVLRFIVLLLILINRHISLLLLKLIHLLLLLLIKNVHSSFFSSCWRNTSWEVSQLVKLIEILSPLQKNLLIFSKMIIWIQVSISENSNILLQISDLIIKIDKFLCLLFDQKRSICHIELHNGLFLIVNILKVSHLVLGTLKTEISLSLQL